MNHSMWIYKVLQKSSSIIDPKDRDTCIRSENVWWQQWEQITLWRICNSFQRGKPEILLMLSWACSPCSSESGGGSAQLRKSFKCGAACFMASYSFSCTPGISSCKDRKSLLPLLLRESVSMTFKEVLTHPFRTGAYPCKEEGMAKQIGR